MKLFLGALKQVSFLEEITAVMSAEIFTPPRLQYDFCRMPKVLAHTLHATAGSPNCVTSLHCSRGGTAGNQVSKIDHIDCAVVEEER